MNDRLEHRVARFFWEKHTKIGKMLQITKNIPN
jgi:hypothetical protein